LGARYEAVEQIIRPLTMAIIAPFLAWYLWRLLRPGTR
jgi:ABC-type Co2+ transport system permease subunit